MRHPDEILSDFDAGSQGTADVDMRGVLHEVIEDICDSYERALQRVLTADQNREIATEMDDYIANYYGDD